MLAAVRMTCSLLKLRIGVAIAASALAGMAAATGPSLSLLQALALVLAVLGASGAAGAFNHYYERDVDRHMQRTRSRPFASGAFAPSAWWPVSFLALLAASLVLAAAVNGTLAALFVFLGAFTYGIVYTVWLKRRSVWNIVIGGLAGSFAVLAGAAAVDPSPQMFPYVLAAVLFLWTPPHFWSLAVAYRDDYEAAGVPMLPVVKGDRVTGRAILAHAVALVALSLALGLLSPGPLYVAFAALGGGHFVARAWRVAVRPDRASAMRCFHASLVQLTFVLVGVMADAALRAALA